MTNDYRESLNPESKRPFPCRFVWPALTIALLSCPSFAADSVEQAQYNFSWRVPQVHRETVERSLRFDGQLIQKKGDKGALVFVFVGVVLLPYLAESILTLRRDMVYGGVTIDLRDNEIEVNTDKSLPAQYILIVKKDGDTEIYERERLATPSDLVEAIGLR